MARQCSISGKGRQHGHRVSHANNKTKHAFLPNLQWKKIYLPDEKRNVRVRVSARMLRTIDKIGLRASLKKFNVSLADIS